MDENELSAVLRGDTVAADILGPEISPTAARLVQLSCCNRLFFAGELDHHVESVCLSPERGIIPVLCPNCRTPIHPDMYRRQSRNLRQRLLDIENVRNAIRDAHEEREELAANLGDHVQLIGQVYPDPEVIEGLFVEYDALDVPQELVKPVSKHKKTMLR